MSPYRQHLPQLADSLFITDGGLETTLIFHDGIDLQRKRRPRAGIADLARES
jgi:hypothetical protein